MPRSDEELLVAWRSGDNHAGEELFERYYAPLERWLIGKVPSCEVEDIVQEAFMACVRGRDKLRDASCFRPYLFGIAYRKLADHLRRKRGNGLVLNFDQVSLEELSPGPLSELAGKQEQLLLLKGLRAIPINYQLILELHYWEFLTTEQIAGMLKIPLGTTRGRLRRARKLVEAAMARLANSPELLRSTVTRLEDWARQCRDHIQAFHTL